jgi:hypothetical protein
MIRKTSSTGVEFPIYNIEEANNLGISYRTVNWRNAEVGEYILTTDKKVIQVIDRVMEKPHHARKGTDYIITGFGRHPVSKNSIFASTVQDKKGQRVDVRQTTKQKIFADYLIEYGISNDYGMWDAESIIQAYQAVYQDNNSTNSLKRGLSILHKQHIQTHIAIKMNIRPILIENSIDDDYIINGYKALLEGSDVPHATKLNTLNRLSTLLGHDAKDRTETTEQVVMISDGELKKLAGYRKKIAETTSSSKKNLN